ncbi:MAG: hypothetical protein QTN59_05175 [Candidatus Electrothrix communis]|nr:MAG: hypothetical protein QTN59_05175 [Candidatus Electrothrix communis]
MDAAQVEYDCCKKMDKNINIVITDRVVFPEKPIQGKGKVGNRSIESPREFRVGVKGVGKRIEIEIGYMECCVVQDIARIIKMPAIMDDSAVDEQSERKKQRQVKKKTSSRR